MSSATQGAVTVFLDGPMHDPDAVLRDYLVWGPDLATRLEGTYAFAIWDERDRRLLLVRDRLGTKPLYYYPTPDGVLFGSEPKSILADESVPRIVDMNGLRELVASAQSPRWALWKGMYAVEPGQVVTVSRSGITTHTYWRLETKPHKDSVQETVDMTRSLLADGILRALASGSPRVLLTGDLGSSVIAGLTPQTPRVDRRAWSADMAALADPALRRKVIAARDMPMGFGELDATLYLLFSSVGAESSVVLSGTLVDEVFGGSLHPRADRAVLMCPHLRGHLDCPADRYSAAERRMRTAIDRTERMATAAGVEIRMPYSDHRLVEYIHNTPSAESSLLRHVAPDVTPRAAHIARSSAHYNAELQLQAKEVLADRDHLAMSLIDWDWLIDAIAMDPAGMPGNVSSGLDWVLDLYHWADMYEPTVERP
nr:asparagine synthase-related protein [Kibdelosporangium sp. MJ126-NF4]